VRFTPLIQFFVFQLKTDKHKKCLQR